MAPRSAQDRKCYRQICPVAKALDVVGDRWTLLILRELLGGPARFTELLEGLPGIAKNLLTTRVRQLEHDGVLRRINAEGTVLYALTDHGAAIRPTLEQLGFWGARLRPVAPPVHARSLRAIAMALQAILVRAAEHLPAEPVVVELELDDGPLEVVVGPQPTVTARPSTNADARIKSPTVAVSDFLGGRGFDKRRFSHVTGDRGARMALLSALGAMA